MKLTFSVSSRYGGGVDQFFAMLDRGEARLEEGQRCTRRGIPV
jgi:hypothetical protein